MRFAIFRAANPTMRFITLDSTWAYDFFVRNTTYLSNLIGRVEYPSLLV